MGAQPRVAPQSRTRRGHVDGQLVLACESSCLLDIQPRVVLPTTFFWHLASLPMPGNCPASPLSSPLGLSWGLTLLTGMGISLRRVGWGGAHKWRRKRHRSMAHGIQKMFSFCDVSLCARCVHTVCFYIQSKKGRG